jgi:hypothetical protein
MKTLGKEMKDFIEEISNEAFEMEIKETFTNIREGKDIDRNLNPDGLVVRSSKPIVFIIHNSDGVPVLCSETDSLGCITFLDRLVEKSPITYVFHGTQLTKL